MLAGETRSQRSCFIHIDSVYKPLNAQIFMSSFVTNLRLFFCVLLSGWFHFGVFYDGQLKPSAIQETLRGEAVEVDLVSEETSSSPKPSSTVQKQIKNNEDIAKVQDLKAKQSGGLSVPKPMPEREKKIVEASSRVEQTLGSFEKNRNEGESCLWSPEEVLAMSCPQPPENVPAEILESSSLLEGHSGDEESILPTASALLKEGNLSIPKESQTQSFTNAVPYPHNNPLPKYPFLARQKNWEGVVWLLVDISEDGSVARVMIDRSCGYKVLDKSARQAVKRWKFVPAKHSGKAVSSQLRIPIRFDLDEG